jgi:spore coat polysaccharide biosynthesis predicted glycosyltransferase SpsG
MARLLVIDDPSTNQARAWAQRARRQRVLCVGVQDAGAADCGADLVVDGGICATPTGSRRRLEGSRYCLLDTRHAAKKAALRRPNRVLIALGGGGHVRRAARRLAMAVAERCPSADIVVASGFVRTPLPTLPRGRWITRSRGLTNELRTSRVAVVAGGQTMYEACSLGVPAVSVAVVGAQRRAIAACSAAGAILDAGGPDMDTATASRVASGVARLLGDRQLRTKVSKRARGLVDGRGADRVARCITRLMKAREAAHV